MIINLVGPFVVNAPFGTEIAFAKGLERIGHEANRVDPNIDREMRGIRNDADATLVFKSCVGAERYLKSLRHPIIVYQPDDARFPHIREMMLMMREYADLLLSFDPHGAHVAKTMGYRAAETLLLTADDELYCPSPVPIERDIDVSFVGSLGDPIAHASRRRMCEIVHSESRSRGWNFQCGTTQDIPTIVDIYRRSKVVLNHATDVGQSFGWGYGLQCRHFEAGMCSTTLLSNRIFGCVSYPGLPFAMFGDESELIDRLIDFLSGDVDCDRHGRQIRDAIQSRHLPQHRASVLIDFIERNL